MDFSPICLSVEQAYHYGYDLGSQWSKHIVKWLDSASHYLPASSTAYVSVIGANLVFFEVAVNVCRVVHHCSMRSSEDYYEMPSDDRINRSLVLGGLFVATLGVSNWAFCKLLHLPLSKWKIVALSIGTCLIYLSYKAW